MSRDQLKSLKILNTMNGLMTMTIQDISGPLRYYFYECLDTHHVLSAEQETPWFTCKLQQMMRVKRDGSREEGNRIYFAVPRFLPKQYLIPREAEKGWGPTLFMDFPPSGGWGVLCGCHTIRVRCLLVLRWPLSPRREDEDKFSRPYWERLVLIFIHSPFQLLITSWMTVAQLRGIILVNNNTGPQLLLVWEDTFDRYWAPSCFTCAEDCDPIQASMFMPFQRKLCVTPQQSTGQELEQAPSFL